MAHINLLPWRENLRKKRQRDFGTATLAAVMVTAVACGGVHFYINDWINFQEDRNTYLKQQIKIVDKKIKEIRELEKVKAELIARMNVIQELQSSRPQIVHLFDEVVTTVPDGAFLTGLAQSGNRVTLNGRAQSNARVSSYMRNIDTSEWLNNPNLEIITTAASDGTQLNQFTLQTQQVVKKEGGDQ